MTNHSVPEIRPAQPDEAEAIRELIRAAYAKWVSVIGREPKPMRADYVQALREHRFDVLDLDGRLCALIETKTYPDHLWIENVAVRPGYQGRGLGRLLLAHAEHVAAEAGILELRLLTNAAFEANVRLYRHIGYRIEREEPFLGGVTTYMCKSLR